MYPSGIEAVLGNATNATSYNASGLANSTGPQPLSPTSQQTPYTFLSTQQGLTSFADSSSNSLAKLFGDATSYRDTGASLDSGVNNTGPSFTHNTTATINGPLASQAPWFSLTENSVTEFLASQTGTNNTDPDATADDDLFSRQIQALISAQSGGASPSAQFNIPNSAFSPTTYLNMSPSPLQSLSSSQTPQSTVGTSSVTSPQTDAEDAVCGVSKVIHVVGEDGRVMRPSEVWTKMGMHNTAEPGELLIDDLCDQMRSKATCKDGRRYMKYDDVKDMVKTREDHGSSRFGDRAQTPAKEPQVVAAAAATAAAAAATGPEAAAAPGPKKKCGGKGYHDPAECQARLNAAFVEANGGL
jgi:AP-1-like factor